MGLFLVVVAMARQIGLLHRRLRPAGARMTDAGLGIGEQAPEIKEVDLQGQEMTLGSHRGKQTLLVFISVGCSSCVELAPALRSLWKTERMTLEILLVALSGDKATNREFVTQHKLSDIPWVVSENVGLEYRVANPPYAVLVDEWGVVRAKGIVNHLEHLESLLNAAKLGHPSWESFAQGPYRDEMTIATNTSG
jgi:methylamine dehydrogenase accessory protein MauD